jgi:orotate phosphoribosyltransferase
MREGGAPLSARDETVRTIREKGHRQLDEPVRLASGDWSRHFIDVKRALATGRAATLAAEAIIEMVDAKGITFDAVGGLTMGADVLAHGVAMCRPEVEWFTVRKQAKERGTKQRIEGAIVGPARHVLLVDDVVTRGGSIVEAFEAIEATGAAVVAAVTVVDRGDFGAPAFEERGVPYLALMTYREIGIPKIGSEPGLASAPV